jgi:hypothetical protein
MEWLLKETIQLRENLPGHTFMLERQGQHSLEASQGKVEASTVVSVDLQHSLSDCVPCSLCGLWLVDESNSARDSKNKRANIYCGW